MPKTPNLTKTRSGLVPIYEPISRAQRISMGGYAAVFLAKPRRTVSGKMAEPYKGCYDHKTRTWGDKPKTKRVKLRRREVRYLHQQKAS